MDSNWVIDESPGRKSDWLGSRKAKETKCEYRES